MLHVLDGAALRHHAEGRDGADAFGGNFLKPPHLHIYIELFFPGFDDRRYPRRKLPDVSDAADDAAAEPGSALAPGYQPVHPAAGAIRVR